jgi:excisionase family DNA binding protein
VKNARDTLRSDSGTASIVCSEGLGGGAAAAASASETHQNLISPAEVASPARLLDASEVAAMLAVPERWVREHTRSGQVPHLRLGRYVRYRREAVLVWLAEQEHGGAVRHRHRPRGTDRA